MQISWLQAQHTRGGDFFVCFLGGIFQKLLFLLTKASRLRADKTPSYLKRSTYVKTRLMNGEQHERCAHARGETVGGERGGRVVSKIG